MRRRPEAPASPEDAKQRAAEHIRRVLQGGLRRLVEKDFQSLAERLNYTTAHKEGVSR
jgi:hypothetical protein